MPTASIHKEIESLKDQIEQEEKMLDIALAKDVPLAESKKLLHGVRLLRDKMRDLLEQKEKLSK